MTMNLSLPADSASGANWRKFIWTKTLPRWIQITLIQNLSKQKNTNISTITTNIVKLIL